jgi:hypothetical protein
MPTHRVSVPLPTVTPSAVPPLSGAFEGGGIANAAVRRAIGRYFVIPPKTAASAPADVLVSDTGGDGDGKAVIGRKRAYSAMLGEAATAAASNGSSSTSAGDRWRERRGYI